jgi:hypothetical protein
MKPQSGKAKGRRLQKRLRDAVLAVFPELQPDDVRSNPMGSSGCDLLLSPLAKRIFPFAPECKNVERLDLPGAMKQAIANASLAGGKPMVVHSRNRDDTYVTVRLEDFLDLLRKVPLES